MWTGFDYRGEPSPYEWPNISSQYGIINTCGFPKDTFFYYQSWWTNKPVLHLFPHWNWPGMEGKEIAVWVYSNLDKVELLFNGQSLGAKDMKKDSHGAWVVKYASVCAKLPMYSARVCSLSPIRKVRVADNPLRTLSLDPVSGQ